MNRTSVVSETSVSATPAVDSSARAASRRDRWMCAVLLAGCIAVGFISLGPPTGGGGKAPTRRVLARVASVDNSRVKTHLVIRTEIQGLRARLLTGRYRGREMEAVNFLTGKLDLDDLYLPGQLILLEYDVTSDGPANARPRGVLRLHWQLLLIVLFGLLLLILAGWTGLNAVLSFLFSALVLWRVFFPLLLRGWSPLLTGLALTALLCFVITLAVGGLNRRGWAAFAGTMLGILLTCGLSTVFTRAFHLNGAVRPFAETLLYSGHLDLDLTGIFIASVFVGSSGAVMDLAMDIATAMDEIHRQQPRISRLEHVRSGLRVGRAVLGTMTTTLLLAYSGSHITMFMLFIARGLPLATIFNTPMVSAEVLNTLVGSFGLVTVAPFTALVCGVFYHHRRRQ